MRAAKSATASAKETVQNVVAKADQMVESNKASAAEKAERKGAVDKAGKHEAKAKLHAKQAEILREYDQKRAQHAAEKEQKKGAFHQTQADKHVNKTGAILDSNPGNQTTSTGGHSYNPAPASGVGTAVGQGTANTPPSAPTQGTSTDAPSYAPAPAPTQGTSTADPSSTPAAAPTKKGLFGRKSTPAPPPVDTHAPASGEGTAVGPGQGTANTPSPVSTEGTSTDAPSTPAAAPTKKGLFGRKSTATPPPVDNSQVPMHGSGVPTHSTLHNDEHDVHTTQVMGGSPNTGSYM